MRHVEVGILPEIIRMEHQGSMRRHQRRVNGTTARSKRYGVRKGSEHVAETLLVTKIGDEGPLNDIL
jgi:hypothetical protein